MSEFWKGEHIPFFFVLCLSMFSLRFELHRHEPRFQPAAPCCQAITCRNIDWLRAGGAHTLTGGPTKLLRATPASVPTLCVPKSPLKRRVRRDGTSRNHHITHHGYLPMMYRSVLFHAFLLHVIAFFSNSASNNMSIWWSIMWFVKYCITSMNI